MRKTLLGLVLFLILCSAFGVAYATRPTDGPPAHAKFHLMGFSAICADQQNLYVIAAGKIMQYGIGDMKLLKTIDMPEPPAPPAGKDGSPCPPPFPHPGGGPPHGIYAGNGYFYLLLGPRIYRYTTPDLTLKDTIELPKPELPKPSAE